MVEIKINPLDFDGACEAMGNALTAYAEANEPEIYLDNDGIGGYEYWGCKGYDEGTNYATLDNDQEETFEINTSGCSHDFIGDLLIGIKEEPFGHKSYDYEMKRGNDVSITLYFMVTGIEIQNINKVVLTAKWVVKK